MLIALGRLASDYKFWDGHDLSELGCARSQSCMEVGMPLDR